MRFNFTANPRHSDLMHIRRLLTGLLTFCLVAVASAQPVPYEGGMTVRFAPLPLVSKPPRQEATYVGGYDLVAKGTSRLIGLSDLTATPVAQGLRIDAIGDYGDAVRFFVSPTAKGLADSPLEITSLRGEDGKPFGSKFLSDAEDMAVDPMTGDHYVSFERDNRVMAYGPEAGLKGKGERLPLSGLPKFPDNEGLEGLTFVREFPGVTSLILGAESGGFWRCWLEDYRCTQLKGPTTPGVGYRLVSLAPLDPEHPDDILALYRFYTPWTGAHSVLRRLKLKGDRLTLVSTLLEIKPPLAHDNYEGVAAVKTGEGYRLYLLSDPIGGGPTRLMMFDYKP